MRFTIAAHGGALRGVQKSETTLISVCFQRAPQHNERPAARQVDLMKVPMTTASAMTCPSMAERTSAFVGDLSPVSRVSSA